MDANKRPTPSKKHHYVPQFYLAGFTDTGLKDGHLHVFDKLTGKSRFTIPKDVAFENNFYKIDLGEEVDPLHVENTLSTLEGSWAASLKCVLESSSLPTDEKFAELMVFIAFMMVRVRERRTVIERFEESVLRKEAFARSWLSEQSEVATTHSKLRSDVFTRTGHVQTMIENAVATALLLGRRTWRLWTLCKGSSDLVCSDNPVSINPTTESATGFPHQLSLASRKCLLLFPLSRRLLIASMIGDDCGPCVLDETSVARANSATMRYARQAFSSHSSFAYLSEEGRIANMCAR
jgi:hypothetical protein